ncbi:hypothetical protein BV881_12355 [Streptomyces sp. ZL-24]|nr:hypothetical protein BV881_12355 [Streptomyces sp. ZL-24]
MLPRYGAPQHNTPGGLSLTATPEEARLHRARPIVEAVLAAMPAPALAVARQLLGTTEAAGAAGCAMPGFVGCDCDHVTGCQHPATAAPPAPADRAVLRWVAATLDGRAAVLKDLSSSDYGEESFAARELTEQADRLRRLADDAAAGVQPPTTNEAHPAEHTWAAELHDPIANEWVPFGSSNVRDTAVHGLARARKVAPLWNDGTPTKRRLVRATTTYTVEPEPAAPAAPEEQR